MVEQPPVTAVPHVDEKKKALTAYRRKLAEYRDVEKNLKDLRKKEQEMQKEHDKSENDIKSLQSVGQIVGEVLKQLTDEKFIVKATNGPRYVVGCRRSINKEALKQGTRVALDMTTLTIMRQLPREVDPLVYKMSHEDPGNITYSEVGGLREQIRELREVVELPLINPDLFRRVGITPLKGCLLYGPPGTGKTLLARAVASQLDCNFLKVVSSALVDKYIGESARMIREMFNYARDHQPCIVFMDEIDAIGGRRFSEGTSADREIQRTLMELLNQMDGFDSLGRVKIIMATNRPDTLDPALLRPGRLDRKIEIGLPNEQSRLEILKIHAEKIAKQGDIDYEAIVKLSDGFSGADLRNVCTEAGLYAIRVERAYVIDEDFMKAVRKVSDAKKLETKLDYKPILAPGDHGLHVHMYGDLDNNCLAAGPHYNPFQRTRGGPAECVRHVGDLGNIVANGTGVATFTIDDINIILSGPQSVLGRGLVVHANRDDLGQGVGAARPESLLTGNAGARVGCCTIAIAQP